MKRYARLASWGFCVLVLVACGKDPEEPTIEIAVATPDSIPGLPREESPFRKTQPQSPDDPLVAEWEGGEFYLSQLDRSLGSGLADFIREVTDEVKLKTLLFQQRLQVLNTFVENCLLIQEAHARDLQLTDIQKEQILKEFRSKFDTQEEYEEGIRNSYKTEDDLMQVLINIELGQMCVIDQGEKIHESMTPEVLRAYYETNIAEKFTPPARSDINWVVVKMNDQRTLEEAKKLAEKLYAEVREKVQGVTTLADKRKVLQDYAFQYSDDFSGRYNYGYMNLYHRDEAWERMAPEFQREIEKCKKPGDLSNVVKVDDFSYGFFLVYNVSASFVNSFDSPTTQKMIPNMYISEKMEEWRKQLKEKYQLKIYEDPLSTLPAVNPTPDAP